MLEEVGVTKMSLQKKIELFTGSLSDLERMTGKKYEPMRTDTGELQELVSATDAKKTELAAFYACREEMRTRARDIGADAIVHVHIFAVYNKYCGFVAYQGYPVRKME